MAHARASDDIFDFDKLKLVEKPDSPRNTGRTVPQTLEGCEGYLKALPLKVCIFSPNGFCLNRSDAHAYILTKCVSTRSAPTIGTKRQPKSEQDD
jgi:hypothetical protein